MKTDLAWKVAQFQIIVKTVTVTTGSFLLMFFGNDELQGVVSSEWMERRLKRLDRDDGKIESLCKKAPYVRTWASWHIEKIGLKIRYIAPVQRLKIAFRKHCTSV